MPVKATRTIRDGNARSVDIWEATGLIVNRAGWMILGRPTAAKLVSPRNWRVEGVREDGTGGECAIELDVAEKRIEKYAVHLHASADIAAIHLVGVQTCSKSKTVFRREQAEAGEMLCTVGFPVNNRHSFGSPPPARYVNYGVVSQFLEREGVGEELVLSWAGMSGELGAPVLDERGHVCGLRTSSILRESQVGITPGTKRVENAIAVKSDTITEFLQSMNIEHKRTRLPKGWRGWAAKAAENAGFSLAGNAVTTVAGG